MPATWTVTTGRGYHYYYRWPDLDIRTAQIAPKLEIRAAGAYVIAPPSVHPNGDTFISGRLDRCEWDDLPELPVEWVSLQPQPQSQPKTLDNYHLFTVANVIEPIDNLVALKRLTGLAEHLANTLEGGRHAALYTISRTLGQLVASRHLTHTQISVALHAAAETERAPRRRRRTQHPPNHRQRDQQRSCRRSRPRTSRTRSTQRLHVAYRTGQSTTILRTLSQSKTTMYPKSTEDKYHRSRSSTNARWLIEPIIPAGPSSVALYATAKTGKSLLVLRPRGSSSVRSFQSSEETPLEDTYPHPLC